MQAASHAAHLEQQVADCTLSVQFPLQGGPIELEQDLEPVLATCIRALSRVSQQGPRLRADQRRTVVDGAPGA